MQSLQLRLENKLRIWSTSRLNPWFICPRQAWAEQTLQVTESSPELSEDIAPLTKGTLVHSIEEHLMTMLGIEVGGLPLSAGMPLHLGVPLSEQEIWESVLGRLSELAPWLSRTNAVSVHRCNDQLDALQIIGMLGLMGVKNYQLVDD